MTVLINEFEVVPQTPQVAGTQPEQAEEKSPKVRKEDVLGIMSLEAERKERSRAH
jgi:hypothetical protein